MQANEFPHEGSFIVGLKILLLPLRNMSRAQQVLVVHFWFAGLTVLRLDRDKGSHFLIGRG